MKKSTQEYVTGIILGLLIGFLIFHKIVFGATVNSPEDAERAKAEAFLQEEGVGIPEEVEFWCEYYGQKYDICPEVIEAVCWVESRCVKTAQDPKKECKGLMQIKPACHKARMQRLNALNIFGTPENIHIGTDYLAELGGSEEIAVALSIYNGQSEAKIAEARNGKLSKYVTKVLAISSALERVHNK